MLVCCATVLDGNLKQNCMFNGECVSGGGGLDFENKACRLEASLWSRWCIVVDVGTKLEVAT